MQNSMVAPGGRGRGEGHSRSLGSSPLPTTCSPSPPALRPLTSQHALKDEGREVVVEVEHSSHEVEGQVVHGPGQKQPHASTHIAVQTDWGGMSTNMADKLGIEVETTCASYSINNLFRSVLKEERGRGEAMLHAGETTVVVSSQTILRSVRYVAGCPGQPPHTAGTRPFVQGS